MNDESTAKATFGNDNDKGNATAPAASVSSGFGFARNTHRLTQKLRDEGAHRLVFPLCPVVQRSRERWIQTPRHTVHLSQDAVELIGLFSGPRARQARKRAFSRFAHGLWVTAAGTRDARRKLIHGLALGARASVKHVLKLLV
jgi:hypothetical protein